MKTTKNGYAVGSAVTLTEEYVSLFDSVDLRNVICEVVDTRLANGCHVYNVAPMTATGVDRARTLEVYASDLARVA